MAEYIDKEKALNVAKDIVRVNDELSIIPRFTTNTEYKDEVNENYIYYLDVNTELKGNDGKLPASDAEINGIRLKKEIYEKFSEYILSHVAE